MKKILIYTILYGLTSTFVFADEFVPEYNKMQILKCEISETLYNENNAVISKTKYHRLFRLDDPYKKLYIQKEPVGNLKYYGDDKIVFGISDMTDDYLINTDAEINRTQNNYKSKSVITYDNSTYGVRHSTAEGTCQIIEQ